MSKKNNKKIIARKHAHDLEREYCLQDRGLCTATAREFGSRAHRRTLLSCTHIAGLS